MDTLKNIPLFEVLSDEEKLKLSKASNLVDLPKFNHLYVESDTADSLYFLVDGMVKIATRSEYGREAIKDILHDNEMFGTQFLTGQILREEYAIALLDGAKILAVETNCIESLMKQNHMFCQTIIKYLGTKLRNVEQRLEAQIFLNAKERIIDFIRDSACKRGRRVGYDHFLKRSLTQQEIANYTGTSRQTVTEVFNELKKSNLIYFNRNKILIREGFNLSCETRPLGTKQAS